MSGHHAAVLAELAGMREDIRAILEHTIETARVLAGLQEQVDALVAAVSAEQLVDDSIVRTLEDLRAQTGTLIVRRRDILQ